MIISCKKDAKIIPDNTAPYYGEVPTVKVENYINRLFIDLLGREALDVEMATELASLRAGDLSKASRAQLIDKLQTSTAHIDGDSSYMYAYYTRFYELSKGRMLEGSTDATIMYYKGLNDFSVLNDSLSGDSMSYQIDKQKSFKFLEVIAIKDDYRLDSIDISKVYERLLDNGVYDQINMNSFNFVRASFNNLFYRYPTTSEFNCAYAMVENDKPAILFGKPGQSKGECIKILVNSTEFYEGMVMWLHQSFLSRNPTPQEVYVVMKTFFYDHDVQKAQKDIMVSDEYANF